MTLADPRVRRAAAAVGMRIVGDAVRLNRSGLALRFALRCSVGVALPLLAGALVGRPLDGVSGAWGALVAGFASRQGVYRTRVVAMAATGLALALAALAGGSTAGSPVLNAVLTALWALGFGLAAALGRAAIILSVNGIVAFVIFSNPPYDHAEPLVQAAMVVAGSLVQTLLLVLVWPLQRFRVERAALAAAYRALASYATGLRPHDLGLPEYASMAAVWTALADPQPFGSRAELAAFEALADEAERLRATLGALNADQHLLDDVGLVSTSQAIRAVSAATGPLFEELATALEADRAPQVPSEAWSTLDRALVGLESGSGRPAPYADDAQALAGQLRSAVRAARAAADGGLPVTTDRPVRPPWGVDALHEALEILRANCTWNSIYARHAIRVAVTIAIAVSLARVVPLAHAQWIALTVALVLRPDFSTTFSRGIARIAGTFGGAVLASLIAAFHPPDPVYAVLAVVCAGLGFALFNVSYAIFSAVITGYVVFLLAFGGSPEGPAAFDRVVATALGGVLALAAYAAWPAWSRALIGGALADLIDAQRRYASLILRGYSEPASVDERELHAARAAAWLARSNAEAEVDQMAGEPVHPRRISLRSALGLLAASRRLGIASLTLRSRLARAAGVPHAVLARFTDDLDAALSALATSLRSGAPSSELPPLRGDQLALKRAVDEHPAAHLESLVSETDLMVDSAHTMADLVRRAFSSS